MYANKGERLADDPRRVGAENIAAREEFRAPFQPDRDLILAAIQTELIDHSQGSFLQWLAEYEGSLRAAFALHRTLSREDL